VTLVPRSCFRVGSSLDGSSTFCIRATISDCRNGSKGQAVSFFPLKDSHGTTQLVVHRGEHFALFDVPVESTVVVEGTVLLRPKSQWREVSLFVCDAFFHRLKLFSEGPCWTDRGKSRKLHTFEPGRQRYAFCSLGYSQFGTQLFYTSTSEVVTQVPGKRGAESSISLP
jgi:hypothetical protein